MERFRDRWQAGTLLGRALSKYRGRTDTVVLGLPRGGIPVAYEVAIALEAPLDALVVRKLGVPGHEELAMGAIASGDIQVIDAAMAEQLGVSATTIRERLAVERAELVRRERLFRGDRPHPDLADRTVLLVDDGLATGSSMFAAIAAVGTRRPARIVVAVPVASPSVCRAFRSHVDEIVCLEQPDPMYAVGLWYEDFSQTSDAEVRALLERAASRLNATARRAEQPLHPL